MNMFLGMLRSYALIAAACMLPRNSRKIVFGAWRGVNFSDNPKYLLLECLKHGDLKCVWVGLPHLRAEVERLGGVEFAERGSWRALWHELTAKYFVCNIASYDDIGPVPTCHRVILINLWHGISFKCIGRRQLRGNGQSAVDMRIFDVPQCGGIFGFLRRMHSRIISFGYREICWTSVSSRLVGEQLADGFPGSISLDRMLFDGMPRNDILVQNSGRQDVALQMKQKYAKLLGLPAEKRWYLYMPTWRHDNGVQFSFAMSSRRCEYERILRDQNAIIVEKQHPAILEKLKVVRGRAGEVVMLTKEDTRHMDVQELYLASERMITDYSSCFLDYALLGRPVIHYAYDREQYESVDSGVLYSLDDVGCGPVVYNEDDLLKSLSQPDSELLRQRAADWRSPIACEKGMASKSCVEKIICR